jgi:hypothetical protein
VEPWASSDGEQWWCPNSQIRIAHQDHQLVLKLTIKWRSFSPAEPDVAVVPGGGDQGESALLLLAQLGQEFGAGDEDRAGEA